MDGKSSRRMSQDQKELNNIFNSLVSVFVMLLEKDDKQTLKIMRLRSLSLISTDVSSLSTSFVSRTLVSHIATSMKLEKDLSLASYTLDKGSTSHSGECALSGESYDYRAVYADVLYDRIARHSPKLAVVVEYHSAEGRLTILGHIVRALHARLEDLVEILAAEVFKKRKISSSRDLALNERFNAGFDMDTTRLVRLFCRTHLFSLFLEAPIQRKALATYSDNKRLKFENLMERFPSGCALFDRETGLLLYSTMMDNSDEDGNDGTGFGSGRETFRKLYVFMLAKRILCPGLLDENDGSQKGSQESLEEHLKTSSKVLSDDDFTTVKFFSDVHFYFHSWKTYVFCVERDLNSISRQNLISLNLIPATQLLVDVDEILVKNPLIGSDKDNVPVGVRNDLVLRINHHTSTTTIYDLFDWLENHLGAEAARYQLFSLITMLAPNNRSSQREIGTSREEATMSFGDYSLTAIRQGIYGITVSLSHRRVGNVG